jgi:hypothetical protein
MMSSKIMFLAMAFGIYLLPLVVNAIQAVPMCTYGLRIVRCNAHGRDSPRAHSGCLCYGAMRLAFGVGWTYIVLAEVVVMVDGLGFLVQNSFGADRASISILSFW